MSGLLLEGLAEVVSALLILSCLVLNNFEPPLKCEGLDIVFEQPVHADINFKNRSRRVGILAHHVIEQVALFNLRRSCRVCLPLQYQFSTLP